MDRGLHGGRHILTYAGNILKDMGIIELDKRSNIAMQNRIKDTYKHIPNSLWCIGRFIVKDVLCVSIAKRVLSSSDNKSFHKEIYFMQKGLHGS